MKHYPVQSITGFVLIDTTNTAYTTLDTLSSVEISAGTYNSADYFCDPTTGIIELFNYTFDFVPKRAKISYTYGYSSAPTIVNELSACLSGIRAWVNFLGGNYNRLNSYTLPEQSYNKGDFYARGLDVIDRLRKRADDLFNQLNVKQRSQIAITSSGYF